MGKGVEQKLQNALRKSFAQSAEAYGIKLQEGVKILLDITCLGHAGSFKLEFAFVNVDRAFFLPVAIEKSHWKPESIFSCVSLARRDRCTLNIPLLVFELKCGDTKGTGITVDAVRSRTIVARSVKHLFPFCSYIFLADSTNKRADTVMRHGKDFTHYFLYQSASLKSSLCVWIQTSSGPIYKASRLKTSFRDIVSFRKGKKGSEPFDLRNLFFSSHCIGLLGSCVPGSAVNRRLLREGPNSMSAYYHATLEGLPGHPAGQGVMRDVFVGSLFAVGVILVIYRGVTRPETYALHLAGVLALGIELFPMQWSGPKTLGDLHKLFAVFFLCIAYVAVFRARDTLSLIDDKAVQKCYRLLYRGLGCAMVGFPLLGCDF